MAVRVADNLKTANDSTEFPVAYGEDIWIDKNKGSGTANYSSIQDMFDNDELGGGSSIQVDQMPLASADTLGQVLQFIGATGTYTHNYFYECVSDGETPPTYSWVQKNVQPSNATAAEVSYDNTTSGLTADDVQEAIDEIATGLGTAAGKDFTDTVRPNSHDLVESVAVYSAINNALDTIYTPRGDLSCAELTSSLLIEANVGSVYQMSDSGTTSSLFINGAGIAISAGDNVGIIKAGADEILFNYMGNAFDLHDYQKVFTGTQAQWEALTTAEKTKYDEAHITDDEIEADNVIDITARVVKGSGYSSGDVFVEKCGHLVSLNFHSTITTAYDRIVYSNLPRPISHSHYFVLQGDKGSESAQAVGLALLNMNGEIESGTENAGLIPGRVWDGTVCYFTND